MTSSVTETRLERSVFDVVSSSYLSYAEEINRYRALPDCRDGLKRVQRRVLLTLKRLGLSEKFHKSASVIGETIKRYHPHGDQSIYATIVNMVNSPFPLLVGEGNFGSDTSLTRCPPAAFRYTEVGLSDLGRKFLQFEEYSEKFVNENDVEETSYLPVPVPYALLGGCIGVGVGITTWIPPFNKEDLLEISRKIVLGEFDDLPVPRLESAGRVEVDDSKRIAEEGVGRVVYRPEISLVEDQYTGRRVCLVTDVPDHVSVSRILKEFRNEIKDGSVFVRDDSSEECRIVVGRSKRVRNISDEEIESRLKRCLVGSYNVRIAVSRESKSVVLGVYDYLRISLSCCLSAYRESLFREREKVSRELRFERVKRDLAERLARGDSEDRTKRELGISDEDFSYFVSKSISRLRREENRERELEEKIEKIDSKTRNLEKSFVEEVIDRF